MEGRSCWGVEDIVQKEVEVHLWGNLRQPNTSHPTPGVVPGDPGLPAQARMRMHVWPPWLPPPLPPQSAQLRKVLTHCRSWEDLLIHGGGGPSSQKMAELLPCSGTGEPRAAWRRWKRQEQACHPSPLLCRGLELGKGGPRNQG